MSDQLHIGQDAVFTIVLRNTKQNIVKYIFNEKVTGEAWELHTAPVLLFDLRAKGRIYHFFCVLNRCAAKTANS